MKMNPVVHFELPYEDRERMADFYAKAFGWKSQMLGPEMGDYVVTMTSEEGANGRPKEVGMINGGFYKKPQDELGRHPSIVIAVDDVGESMKKIENAGGKILGKPENIPGVGIFVSIIDSEGNRVSILEPLKNM